MTSLARRHDSGSAMVLAAIAFILMAGIGAALFSMSITGQKTTLTMSNADAAYHAAEAGVDDALNKLNAYKDKGATSGADWNIDDMITEVDGVKVNQITGTFKDGSFTVIIEPAYAGLGEYKISSTGVAHGETRGIVTWISAEEDPGLFKYGLFGDVVLDAGGTLDTDGWDSTKGSYTPTVNADGTYHNKTGHVASNGDVELSNNVKVYGNATPGPSGEVTGGGLVTGTKEPAKTEFPMPAITYDPPDDANTSLGLVVTGGNYKVSTWELKAKEVQVFDGDVTLWVDGDINLPSNAQIVVNGKLTIYQNTGKFVLHGGGQTTTKGGIAIPGAKAENLIIYTNTTSTVTVNGHAGFYGAVYAPNAPVKLNGTADYFGSIVADKIDALGTAKFHYDESLAAMKAATISINVKSVEKFIPETATE